MRLVTTSIHPDAVIEFEVLTTGVGKQLRVEIEYSDAAGLAGVGRADVSIARARGQLSIASPKLWSAERPHLYDVAVRLFDGNMLIEDQRLRSGIRTVAVDPTNGLRVNGEKVLLRGACVHHDNGVLGAATHRDAERRRARLLKSTGFNAIRSSHNPLSRAFLDACDEFGLYVLDELTDVWYQHKTPYDGAADFDTAWRDDARAMIAEDRNRPSVIMYSIGHEIGETSTPRGIALTTTMNDFFHELDPTRPTTAAINFLLNWMLASRGASPFQGESTEVEVAEKKSSTAANALAAQIGSMMKLIARLPKADKATRDALAATDIAGYNYAYSRYRGDRRRYPGRIILGTESFPGDLPAIWKQVQSVPGVIGDFIWTGWDYLGEVGLGYWSYGDEPVTTSKRFPGVLSGSGVLDITGLPNAAALLAQAVWGTLSAPAIAVRPLDRAGQRIGKTPWRSTDAIPSWSWRGISGKAEIEVYSDDDQVELLLNGRSLGRKRAGRRAGFVARFSVSYEPGTLEAVGFRRGREVSRSSLSSARTPRLRLRAEETVAPGVDELAFVWVELADDQGIVESNAIDVAALEVSGGAELVGFGSASPTTTETFGATQHQTYRGRALAVLRGTGAAGPVQVVARSTSHGDAELELEPAAVPVTVGTGIVAA
ncbi:glycoside hydrolase family 2 TIM barrel-domain containing protein [Microbacterium rhizosphaerae]|uniref:Glycoside hydrolase family 2 TIM barrel-domain containing protein n=1 Tax=Microbacterium rhizosphaerae TaxID=1678237 RepID=A0ABZ0SRC3_9MICO|nr:glycoside hydrolase family 2 TIM barrel-domain containing protein [Microbacterium rhizosphaerae]WPR91315.1 glycoside hydrolase family 2 TIM barrel-domain containing protein [Microbacterium rhizosphaerae]